MDDSQFLNQVGAKIKSIRTNKNLTQYELAISCEFEAASMSRIESGKINITLITLRKIGSALEVGLAEFFKEEEPTKDNLKKDGAGRKVSRKPGSKKK